MSCPPYPERFWCHMDEAGAAPKLSSYKMKSYKPFPEAAALEAAKVASQHAAYMAAREAKQKALESVALTPLTKEAWDAFDGKARWDCIVALRGPDLTNSGTLKWFTSSVIRYALSRVMRVGGLINTNLPFIVLPNASNWSGFSSPKGNFDASHFLGHVKEAADYLGIPAAWVSEETFAKVYSPKYSYYDCEVEFYKELKGDLKYKLGVILMARGHSVVVEEPQSEGEESPCQE